MMLAKFFASCCLWSSASASAATSLKKNAPLQRRRRRRRRPRQSTASNPPPTLVSRDMGRKKSPTNNCSGEFDPSSATKVLQACIYMYVYSGLFLKSLVASSIVKVDGLTLIFTFKYKVIKLSSMRIWNWTILVAKTWTIKIGLLLQACKRGSENFHCLATCSSLKMLFEVNEK